MLLVHKSTICTLDYLTDPVNWVQSLGSELGSEGLLVASGIHREVTLVPSWYKHLKNVSVLVFPSTICTPGSEVENVSLKIMLILLSSAMLFHLKPVEFCFRLWTFWCSTSRVLGDFRFQLTVCTTSKIQANVMVTNMETSQRTFNKRRGAEKEDLITFCRSLFISDKAWTSHWL